MTRLLRDLVLSRGSGPRSRQKIAEATARQRDLVLSRGSGPRSRHKIAAAAALCVIAVPLGACTPSASRSEAPVSTTTITTHRLSPSPSSAAGPTPRPARTVTPLPPGHKPSRGEVARRCPYIRPGVEQDPRDATGPNVADIEGDHVYRTTVLVRLRPVGCRFYFYAPPYEAIADIRPATYPSAIAARNAMVLTARTGTQLLTVRDFVRGLDGISFRTAYFGPDRRRDWAFVFAKGRVLVTVYTQRRDTSQNAVYLAQAIAAKI